MNVSIIIPTYNETDNICAKLQRFGNLEDKSSVIEVIVADSPVSDDDMLEICSSQSIMKYVRCPRKGRASQMNYAASQAKGEILLFLHADVVLPEDFSQRVVAAIKEGNQFGFFSYRFDSESTVLKINSRFTKKDGLFAGGGDQCQFITKELFEDLGGYDEGYCIMEDFKMIDTIRMKAIPYTVIDSPAIVSARKYEQNSWLKVNLINFYVFMRYKIGTPPVKLRSLYQSLLREGV